MLCRRSRSGGRRDDGVHSSDLSVRFQGHQGSPLLPSIAFRYEQDHQPRAGEGKIFLRQHTRPRGTHCGYTGIRIHPLPERALFRCHPGGVSSRRAGQYSCERGFRADRSLLHPAPGDTAADEDRISADEFDFFMDEIETWLGIPQQLKGIFDAEHADLYSKAFWENCQHRAVEGEVIDIFPYGREKRFPRSR
ncbi:MAG: bifunctional isocitrate dehydrogenase kinase/phosphatase [Bacteroidetes bacterium]|nr:bifunctional isocitrate dehydrogenase kinase/phosphatase [Bacteroidota bacterium]